ncbi:sensor histidine kinase [Amycolatopsis sp. cg5]|uniref:sensor histidine kinase n=1 Tax=Amycolatopsis sp. cg5 TaxID=3238802 RepID=UPI003523A89B
MFLPLMFTRPRGHAYARCALGTAGLGYLVIAGLVPGTDTPWLAGYVLAYLCLVATIMLSSQTGTPRLLLAAVLVTTTVGGVMVVAGSTLFGALLLCEMMFIAGFSMPLATSWVIFAMAVGAAVLGRDSWGGKAVLGAVLLSVWLSGASRRQYLKRMEQAEMLVAETRHSAALAERARIAREIHDILAHSLSALSLQLEAAGAMLHSETKDLTKIAACVDRASRLAREGIIETSRAVQALREDAVSLPDLLPSLVDGENVRLSITGDPRELPPAAGLTLYRTVQEALTNARKHAPGSPVTVELGYARKEVTATVTNPASAAGPLTGTGAGYGLTGIRERAELVGGTLVAGPLGDGWQVSVKVPS